MTVRGRFTSFDVQKMKNATATELDGAKGSYDERRFGATRLKKAAAAEASVVEMAEGETDTESGGSSEEMESPRSVAKWRRRKAEERKLAYLHSQVLRIREEDLHLGQHIGEGISANKDKANNCSVIFRPDIDQLFSRPILPCSPLSGKVNTSVVNSVG